MNRRKQAARACGGAGVCRLLLATLIASLPATAGATPVISELFYDQTGSDNGHSFVEIYGVAGTSLEGLTLEGVNGANGAVGPVIALSGLIPGDGVFVVADLDGGTTLVPHYDQLANFDFQNGPDSVVLLDGTTVLDALGYGVFEVGEIFAGEGGAATDAPAGSSLARRFADLDTDDNAFDFTVLASPTPGEVTLQPVPEPGSGVLGALGLALLGWRRRAALQLSSRPSSASRAARFSSRAGAPRRLCGSS